MRQKIPLMLMELIIMVLVFALAAALCLQVFAYCERQSETLQQRDRAVVCAQNAAELLKGCAGDVQTAVRQLGGSVDAEGCWRVGYDAAWQQTVQDPVFVLTASPVPSDITLLGQAQITVQDPAGKTLTCLQVCWQKEGDYEQ